jgi:NitT/TauT family transport system substrate-binding protein
MKKFGLIFCLLVLTAAACAPKPAVEPDQVTLQLKWVHQAQFAGFYLAEKLGYYAEENIDLTMIEGGSGISITDTVASGEADFAITSPIQLVTALDQGDDLKSIATILQISPVAFISMADSGITQPQDFVGKKVAAIGDADYEIQLRAMLDFIGLDAEQVDLKNHGYGIDDLASGEIDVHGFYSTGGLLRVLNAGYQVNIIYPGDYGQHYTNDAIITSQTLIDQNPDLVLRFLRASLKGWKYAIENEVEAVDETMLYALESDRALQEQMMTASIPLIHTGDNKIGWMDPTSWQVLLDALHDMKFIQNQFNLDQIVDAQFLDQIYPEAQ